MFVDPPADGVPFYKEAVYWTTHHNGLYLREVMKTWSLRQHITYVVFDHEGSTKL